MKKIIILMFVLLLPTASAQQGKVTVDVAGFITHAPMKATVDAIKEVTSRYDNVEVIWHDETTPEGESFLKVRGLAGHIPLAVFIDGELTYEVNGTPVTFRDFEGYKWKKEELDYVLKAKTEGKITSIPTSPQNNQNPPYLLAGGLIVLSITLLILIIRKQKS